MGEPCVHCAHTEDEHDAILAYCMEPACRCLGFVSEADDWESALASGDDLPQELDFDGDGA